MSSEVHGEVRTGVSLDGRMSNREDVTTGTERVEVPFHRATSTLFAGFRTHWLDGTEQDTGTAFEVCAGAGCGSRYLTFEVTLPDGRTVQEYVDIVEVVEQRVAAIMKEHGIEPSPA